jgi:ATP-dependent DNA ligase
VYTYICIKRINLKGYAHYPNEWFERTDMFTILNKSKKSCGVKKNKRKGSENIRRLSYYYEPKRDVCESMLPVTSTSLEITSAPLPPPPPPPQPSMETTDVGSSISIRKDDTRNEEASSSSSSSSSLDIVTSEMVKPMLAKAIETNRINFIKDKYIFEEKFDGERMIAVVMGPSRPKDIKYFSRNLKPLKAFPHNIVLKDGYTRCIFDGELVFMDDNDTLIPICDTGVRASLKKQYRVFDVQMVNGRMVHCLALEGRKRLLNECLLETEHVAISKFKEAINLDETMKEFDRVVNVYNGEGLILKRMDQQYLPGVRGWIKLKSLYINGRKKEFDLFARKAIKDKNGLYGILECGYYTKDGKFNKVCNVSSGIDGKIRNQIRNLVDPDGSFKYKESIVTIIADMVTKKGSLRHPIFKCFRFDIPPEDITIDRMLFVKSKQ